jgi:hypothetical protein
MARLLLAMRLDAEHDPSPPAEAGPDDGNGRDRDRP